MNETGSHGHGRLAGDPDARGEHPTPLSGPGRVIADQQAVSGAPSFGDGRSVAKKHPTSLGPPRSVCVLVAAVGNIFLGDDAFGNQVIKQLRRRDLPRAVRVRDFGIRLDELAEALSQGYGLVILLNTARRGGAPGTVYVSHLNWDEAVSGETEGSQEAGHDVLSLLSLVNSSATSSGRIYMVECEPDSVENVEGMFRLTLPVAEAIPRAIQEIDTLINEFFPPPANGAQSEAASATRTG